MWESIRAFWDLRILKLGNVSVSIGGTVYFVALVVALFIGTRQIRKWLVRNVLVKTSLAPGERQTVGSIFQYAAVLVGLLIIVQAVGIDLTTLDVVAGALGVGLGFGLQNITSNFISGLIILFERPIKLGDRIVVGDIEGDVVEIRVRSTTVISNDNIAIIVPNSKFVSENVVNWSYHDRTVRFSIPVRASYGVNAIKVESLLLDVARANPDVLADPEPVVRFIEFGESALIFELRVWSTTLMHRKGKLRSDLNFAIYESFARNDIPIPPPQRAVHLVDGVDVRLVSNNPSESPRRTDSAA